MSHAGFEDVLIAVVTAAAIVGVADTLYLSIASSSVSPAGCSLLEGCKAVLSSRWSQFWGVQTAVLGSAYYFLLAVLSTAYWWWRDRAVLYTLLLVSSLALLVTLWLVYLQVFVIGALCEYCLVSAGLTLIIWAALAGIFGRQVTSNSS